MYFNIYALLSTFLEIFCHYIIMQKLRDLYKETQRNTNDDFDKVTQDRMKKILAYANREQQNILDKQQFALYAQIKFYQEKFTQIVDTFDKAIQQGYKRPKIQAQLQTILKNNFADNGQHREENHLQAVLNESPSKLKSKKPVDDEAQISKSLIKSYFDHKNEQIQKSKVGFKNVLEDMPYAPKKFAIKVGASNLSNINNDEINKYKAEISKLKHELQNKEQQKQFNMGLLQIEKRQSEQRIKQLLKKIDLLQFQNIRLKQQPIKNFAAPAHQQFIPHHQPPLEKLINHDELQQRFDDYNPYTIHYRNNDLGKLKNRHLQKQPNNQKNVMKSHTNNNPLKQEVFPQKLPMINFDLLHQIPKQPMSPKNSEHSFNNSRTGRDDMINDAKYIAFKSKISFFKPSMILYRGSDVQIAVKSVDIIKLSSKKVSFYILNKQKSQKMVQLQYKVDLNYYELQTKKKASILQGLQQAREEIEVRLKNLNDLDSLIEANITIRSQQGTKQLKVFVPALFIEFIEDRPEIQKRELYTHEKILPFKQFSSLYDAEELIPLQNLYGDRYDSGRVYAISKNHQGYIFIKWIGGVVQIQTIPAFKLLMGKLMSREY